MSEDWTRRDWLTHHVTFVALGVMGARLARGNVLCDTPAKTTPSQPDDVLHFGVGTHVIDTNLTVPSTVLLQIDPGAVLSIAAGRTVTIDGPIQASLLQIFTGAGAVIFGGGHVAQVYPQWWGASGDGRHDDTGAINTALRAAAPAGVPVELVAGVYKTTAPIILPDSTLLHGVPLRSIIRPTPALGSGNAVHLGSVCTIDGLYLDGRETTNAIGLGVGTAGSISLAACRNMRISGFGGTTGMGILLADCVTSRFEGIYMRDNAYNLIANGTAITNGPTDALFLSCQFNDAVHKGIWLQNGRNLHFLKCDVESNAEEGVYAYNPAAHAPNLDNVVFQTCWFENNWTSLGGAARQAQYDVWVRGDITNFAATVSFRDCEFPISGSGERQIRLTDAFNFLVDHCTFGNVPSVLIEGRAFGAFDNWRNTAGPNSFYTGHTIINRSTGLVTCTSCGRSNVP